LTSFKQPDTVIDVMVKLIVISVKG